MYLMVMEKLDFQSPNGNIMFRVCVQESAHKFLDWSYPSRNRSPCQPRALVRLLIP